MVEQIGNPLDGMASLQKSGMALSIRLQKTLEGIPELTTGWDSSKSVRVDVGRPMSDVDTNLSPETGNLPLSFDPTRWTGEAADAYKLRTATQPDAAAPSIPAVILATLASIGIAIGVLAVAEVAAAVAFTQWTAPEGVFLNGAWPQGTFNYAP